MQTHVRKTQQTGNTHVTQHITQHSIFPLPLSTCLTHHYPCEARRQPQPGDRRRRGGIMGNVSRHMSKVQPLSWKSCVWCDSGLPAANSPPQDSVQLTQKLPVLAQREKESKREQERANREGHQHCSARINAFPLAVSPHCTAIVLRKSAEGFCVSECQRKARHERAVVCVQYARVRVRGQQSKKDIDHVLYVFMGCLKYSTHTNHFSVPQHFSINLILSFSWRFPVQPWSFTDPCAASPKLCGHQSVRGGH